MKNNKQRQMMKNIAKWIFSIGNDNRNFQKNKFIIIFGFKIYLTLRVAQSKLFRKHYLNYLENHINQDKSGFVDFVNGGGNQDRDIKIIAFYLPQFHAIELNDKNFGKGFTEWSNVAKAMPLFSGHYQPHLPYDIGFYDLSSDSVMYRQVELAKAYQIYGFCFHYYWFSGKRLLEKPIFNYHNNKDLDLPFCLCWANENWSRLWDGGDKEVIVEQKLQENDDEKFFYDILPFFKDERYIKVDNKPILLIYNMKLFEKERILRFIKTLKNLAKKEGLAGVFILGVKSFDFEEQLEFGADAKVEFPPHNMPNKFDFRIYPKYANKNANGRVFDINEYVKKGEYVKDGDSSVFKGAFPSWDNTARKAKSGADIYLCSPSSYKAWLKNLITWTRANHKQDRRFIFINAWNEWGEGAHLEPDTRYGYAYLQATREALDEARD